MSWVRVHWEQGRPAADLCATLGQRMRCWVQGLACGWAVDTDQIRLINFWLGTRGSPWWLSSGSSLLRYLHGTWTGLTARQRCSLYGQARPDGSLQTKILQHRSSILVTNIRFGCNLEMQGSNPDRAECLLSWLRTDNAPKLPHTLFCFAALSVIVGHT